MKARIICGTLAIAVIPTALGLLHARTSRTERSSSPGIAAVANCGPRTQVSSGEFRAILQTIRKAWLEADAERAVGCFTPDAILSLPPSVGVSGREGLLKIFGAGHDTSPPKSIEWHHVVFDSDQQLGAAEFTMERRVPNHGVVIIKFSKGLISNWRQYSIASDLSWEKFIGMNSF